MALIKRFEAFGIVDPSEGKQFRMVTKNGGRTNIVLPTQHFRDTWDMNKVDYDQVRLDNFLTNSALNDVWENNTHKITCVEYDPSPVGKTEVNNDKKFKISSIGGKRGDFNLRMPYILKTWDTESLGTDGVRLIDFIHKSKVGDVWTSTEKKVTCIAE